MIDIRPSFLTSFGDCSLKAVVHYFPELFKELGYTLRRTDQHMGAAVGTGVHAGVADALAQKLQGHLVSVPDATEKGIIEFRKSIEHGFVKDVLTRNPNIGEQQIEKMVRAVYGTIGYKTQPAFVEKKFAARLTAIHPNYRLVGTPDYGTIDRYLPDLKTGRTLGPHLYQSGGYLILVKANNYVPKTAGIIFLKRTPVDQDQERPVEQVYDIRAAERVAWAQIRRVIRDMEEFKRTQDPTTFQMNPDSLFCGEKFCRAYATPICPMFKK